jgi:thioredoxin reductase (NADPH)
LRDEITGATTLLEVQGAFEAIGHLPNTQFLEGQLTVDSSGNISTTPGGTLTSVEGVFAAGDVADRKYRQAITAAASGCMAAIDAEHWLGEKNLLG